MKTTIIDLQDRTYLQNLRHTASIYANNVLNKSWERAYLALAVAADNLDAIQARASIIQSDHRPLNIGTEVGMPECECGAPECECDQHSGCQCGSSEN